MKIRKIRPLVAALLVVAIIIFYPFSVAGAADEGSSPEPQVKGETVAVPSNEATEIPLTITNMVLANQDKFRAQYYEFHALSFDWAFSGPITAGQYFTVTIDPELNLHPNTLEQLPNLKYNGVDIATPSVDVAAGTITYTFNKNAEGIQNFTGHMLFNVSVKGPEGMFKDVNNDGKNDVDRYGHYYAGTKQPITIAIGDYSQRITITHLGFPTVPESIYNVNSWMNTTVLEHSVFWAPEVTGDFIQAIVEVTNNSQYQPKNISANPPARDLTLNIQFDPEDGPFVTQGGFRITAFDGVTDPLTDLITYNMTGRQVFSFDQVGYVPGSDNFTIDFGKLGYTNPKPPETRYVVEYFIHHVTTMIPYSDANKDPNNMATITYYADLDGIPQPGDPMITYRDGAFWFPNFAGANAGANAEPALELVTVGVSKTWITGTNPREDVQFVLLGDGKPATFLDGGNGFVEIPASMLLLPVGESERIIRNLPYRSVETGEVINYTLEEVAVDGFTSSMSRVGMRFKMTNISTETLDIPVIKKWVGGDDKNPSEVKVQLFADGNKVNEISLNAAGDWVGEFVDIPRFDPEDGHEIAYTIGEVAVPGFRTEITGNVGEGFMITNTGTSVPDVVAPSEAEPTAALPGSVKANAPKTGDESAAWWTVLLMATGAAVMGLTKRRED